MTYIGPVGQSKMQQSVYITPASPNLAAELSNIPGFSNLGPGTTQNGYYTFLVILNAPGAFVLPAGHFALYVQAVGSGGNVQAYVANGPAGPGDFSTASVLFNATAAGAAWSFSSDGINLKISIAVSATLTISYIV